MRLHLRTALLLSLVLALFGHSQPVSAAHASRIELRDGSVFEAVIYQVDNTYKVISIESTQGKRTVSFTEIAVILDTGGKDVTADCLGRYFRPSRSATQGEESFSEEPLPMGYRKHPFSVGFGGGLNYSFPGGDWYEGTRSGLGFRGYLLITVARKIALRGTISKAGVRHDPDELFAGGLVLQDELSWSVWRYFMSVQYCNWPHWRTGGKVMYYVYTGLGAVSHKLSGSAVVAEYGSQDVWLISGTDAAETKFATTFGVGLVAMVSKSVGLELGAGVDIVYVGRGGDYNYAPNLGMTNVVTAGLFDLELGVVFLLE